MPKAKAKKRAPKKKVDPNRPKRPASSFMFFANAERPGLRAANPKMAVTDIAKKLGEMWRELSEVNRAPFEAKAAVDRQRYKDAMVNYTPPPVSSSSSSSSSDDHHHRRKKKAKKTKKPKRKPKKKAKDPNKPKRGMSSFMYFANAKRNEVRQAHPELKITEVGKRLGVMWNELDDAAKKPYIDLAEADKNRYRDEMKTYTPPPVVSSSSSSSSSSTSSSSSSYSSSSD
jgi:upstream-binding transcription factor